jgi:hypothetical protein
MTQRNRIKIVPIFAAVILLASLLWVTVSHAAGNILYVTPASSQLNIGGTLNINVRGFVESSGSSGSVSGTLTYPSNLLQVVSGPSNNGVYSNLTLTQGNGTIGFSGTQTPGPTGQVQVFSVSFKAIGAGSASIGFTSNSNINQSATNRNSGSYTIVNPNPPATCPAGQIGTPPSCTTPPPATCPAGQTGTPPNCRTPSTTPPPVETPPTTTPTDSSDEEVTTPDASGLITVVPPIAQYTSAVVSWKLNAKNGTTDLVYGVSSDDVATKTTIAKNTDGLYTATIPNLSPGVRYYFTISGTSDDKKTSFYKGVFTTRGYPVKLIVTEGGAPSSSAKVKIGQQSYATSKDGVINLSLAQGTYNGTITTDTSSAPASFTVAAKAVPATGSAPDLQTFTLDVPAAAPASGPSMSIFAFIGILLVGVVLLTIAFMVYVNIRRRQMEGGGGSYALPSMTSVIIDDGYDWRADAVAPPTDPNSPPSPGQSQDAPYSIPLPPPPSFEPQQHNNSIHLDEDEPKDMFELAKEQTTNASAPASLPPADSGQSATSRQGDWPQSPNPPRSTTP